MSEINSSVVRAALTQLSKSDTAVLSEEPTYAVKIDHDTVKDVLPILMPRLLEVISNPSVSNEIRHNIYHSSKFENNGSAQYERTGTEVSRSDSNRSNNSTTLLLPTDNAQRAHTLNFANDDIFYEQGRSTKRVKIVDERSFSWVTLKELSCTIALIAITVVVTMAGVSIVWKVWLSRDTENSLTFHNVFSKINPNDDPYEFTLNSFDEYKRLAQRQDIRYTKLVINIASPGDWPTGVVLPTISQLNHLHVKGTLHGKKLVDLVASISSIERLTVDNEGNHICSETQQLIGTINTKFKTKTSIKSLALNQFTTSCSEILEYMHRNMTVEYLEKVSFTNGKLTEINIESFENLLLHINKLCIKLTS